MKVQTRGEEYEIKVVNGAHEYASQEGPLYLKIMISRITIDSTSTVANVRSSLSELDKHRETFDNDVTKFNE